MRTYGLWGLVPLGCWSCTQCTVVRFSFCHGSSCFLRHHRSSTFYQLLYRLLSRVEWRSYSDGDSHSQHNEFCHRIRVSLLMPRSGQTSSDESGSITPWVTRMGLQNAFIVAAFVGLAQGLTVFIFIRYGQSMRRASVSRYQHYREERMAAGLIH